MVHLEAVAADQEVALLITFYKATTNLTQLIKALVGMELLI